MKKINKLIPITAIAFSSLICAVISTSKISLFPSFGNEQTWWESNCVLPEGYTSIGNIVEFGDSGTTYKTRGTITFFEGNSFFMQSQGHGIYVYSTKSLSGVGLGKVVDIEGSLTWYNGMPELTGDLKVNVISNSNPYPVEPIEFSAKDFDTYAPNYNCLFVKVTDLVFSSATYSTKKATLYFNDGTIQTYLNTSDSLQIGHDFEELADSYENESFTFTGVISDYKTTHQLRVNSLDCFELVEGEEKDDDDDDPPVITGGTVVANPTQTGDVLGPLYIPAEGEKPSVSFLEMVGMYGDSTFVDYGNFEMLIDGGADEDTANVMNYLKNHCEDKQLEVLILSHPHVDHFGGIDNLSSWKNTAGISKIKYIIDYGYYDAAANNYESVRSSYISGGATYYSIYEMMHNSVSEYPNVLKITEDMRITFLDTEMYGEVNTNPPSSNDNDTSIASVLSIGNSRYFLCGDITNETGHGNVESTLISKYGASGLWSSSTYNIAKTNHHGSDTHGSNSQTWINGIMPNVVVASAALIESNRTANGPQASQHPHEATIDRYCKQTPNVYATMINGTLTFTHNNFVDNPTMSGAGRTLNYYDKDGKVVDPETEKLTKYKDSVFFQICPKYGA